MSERGTAEEPQAGPSQATSAAEPVERGGGFSPRALAILIGTATLAMVLTFYFLVHQQKSQPGSSSQPVGVEKRALGLRALVDLLGLVGIRVTPVSAFQRPSENRRAVVLLPEVGRPETVDAALSRFKDTRAIVFLLPKRAAIPPKRRVVGGPAYAIAPAGPIRRVVNRISRGSRLVRTAGNRPWDRRRGNFRHAPALADPQLVSSGAFETVLGTKDGAWVAALRESGSRRNRVYVISDPDPLQNHGLDDGANAELAVELIRHLLGRDGVLLIDDTVAGSVSPPSFWRELFRFPLLVLTLSAALAMIFVLLKATGQFGSRDAGRTSLRSGRATIIDASTALMSRERHAVSVLRRYWHQSLRTVGRQYRLTDLASRSDIISRLQAIEDDRELSATAAEIERECGELESGGSAARAVQQARRIHTWRKEMLSGHRKTSAAGSRARR